MSFKVLHFSFARLRENRFGVCVGWDFNHDFAKPGYGALAPYGNDSRRLTFYPSKRRA